MLGDGLGALFLYHQVRVDAWRDVFRPSGSGNSEFVPVGLCHWSQ